MDFFDRIETARSRWNVLEHSFYRRWSAGELSREELAVYAGEYRHAVEALADGLAAAAPGGDPSIAEHAAEGGRDVAPWDRVARGGGGGPGPGPRPGVVAPRRSAATPRVSRARRRARASTPGRPGATCWRGSSWPTRSSPAS